MTDEPGGVDDPGCVTPGAGVGFLISQLGYLIGNRFKDLLAPLGMEPRQFLVLRHVAQAQGSSQQALGQALRIPPSRMVSIVDSLEQRGLVERRANPTDRRARALHLTPEGRSMLARTFRVAVEHERVICGDLSPEEREMLLGMLRRLTLARELVPGVHPALNAAEEAAS